MSRSIVEQPDGHREVMLVLVHDECPLLHATPSCLLSSQRATTSLYRPDYVCVNHQTWHSSQLNGEEKDDNFVHAVDSRSKYLFRTFQPTLKGVQCIAFGGSEFRPNCLPRNMIYTWWVFHIDIFEC